MKLKNLTIHKYKCIENEQQVDIEEDITILVGMNESGKTAVLESLAKSNYFQDDPAFRYNPTHDYPRKEKKKLDKSGDDPIAITAVYEIPQSIVNSIVKDLGKDVFSQTTFSVSTKFSNGNTYNDISCDRKKFLENKTQELGIYSKAVVDKLIPVKNTQDLQQVIAGYTEQNLVNQLKSLDKYFTNKNKWGDPLCEYIMRAYLSPNRPKFLYYDEYYSLPSRISIEKLQEDELVDEEMKTAKALFDLADINIDELLESDNYEDFKAELEATQATITDELFKFWDSNKNLEILFDIDKREKEVERSVL